MVQGHFPKMRPLSHNDLQDGSKATFEVLTIFPTFYTFTILKGTDRVFETSMREISVAQEYLQLTIVDMDPDNLILNSR